jgi:hypothetical protein
MLLSESFSSQPHVQQNSHGGFVRNSGAQAPVRSVASANDLLDDHDAFDDTASYPGAMSGVLVPAQNPNQQYPGAPMNAQQMYQEQYGAAQQQQPDYIAQQQHAFQAQQQHGQYQAQGYGGQPQYGAPQQQAYNF